MVLLQELVKFRYLPQMQYWIWLLIAIRLLLPFTITTSHAVQHWDLPEHTIRQLQAKAYLSAVPESVESGTMITLDEANPFTEFQWTWHWYEIFLLVWLIGLLSCLGWQVVHYQMKRRELLRWSIPVMDGKILFLCEQICRQKSWITPPPLYWCAQITSPMVMGWYRPVLLLPQQNYSEEEISLLLQHELQHYYHSDIPYKWLLMMVQAVHWFNPFIWLMSRHANSNLEFCCDATVLQHQSIAAREQYSYLLLQAAANNQGKPLACSTNFSMSAKKLQQRIAAIFAYPQGRKGIFIFSLFAVLIFSTGFLFVPGIWMFENGITARVDVDGDGIEEQICRVYDIASERGVYEICWQDGRKLSRYEEDYWGYCEAKGADVDGDGELEIATWFCHTGSTHPEWASADLVVYDKQPDGSYQLLPVPTFRDRDFIQQGLDFRLLYWPEQEENFLLIEQSLPWEQSIYLPVDQIPPKKQEVYNLSAYTADYEVAKSGITADITLKRDDGQTGLYVWQCVGDYWGLLRVGYRLSWDGAGNYHVDNLRWETLTM